MIGLIPAHAGKTAGWLSTSSQASGSSPRMRGKRVMVTEKAGAVGLIPAHAGKTPEKR